jgi:ATP-binding cassette, subfamily B, bacterial MsbA
MFGRTGRGGTSGGGAARHVLSRKDVPVFRRLLAFVRPYGGRLALAAFCLFGVSISSLVFPWIVRSLVDSVFLHHDERTLNLIAIGLFAVFVVQALLNFGQTYLISWVGERIVADLRRRIYDHLTSLSLSFFSENRTGELMSRVTNDVNAVQTAVSGNLLSLLQQLVTLFGSLAIIFYLDWRLSLLMVVVTPMLAFCGAYFGRWLGRIARQVQAALGEATTVLEETLGNMRVVQSFTREPYESERFGGMVERVFQLTLGRIRVRAAFVSLISFLAFGSITLVLWFGGREVLHGDLTPGGLISFLFYIFLIAGPLGTLTNLYSQIRESMGAATRIFELLDTAPAIADRPEARVLGTSEGRVTFTDVRFSYTAGHEVLRGVSFAMEPGSMVALVGPSGAGKTTIATLIPRFYEPDSGIIAVDGVDIRGVTLESLRAQIAVVPQDPVLFAMSIRENIAYGRLGASDQDIMGAAEAANAREFIDKLPNGMDSQVGERGVKLSGGQRQRIAIARAILRDPRILILDEATSSLDNESERLVQEALEHLMVGRTTLVIAHRLTTVQRADRIVVIDDGAVLESGTHDELLAAEGLYHRLYTLADRTDDRLRTGMGMLPEVLTERLNQRGHVSVPALD